MNRAINIDLAGYPKIIDPNILVKVANRKHPMAAMPYYNKQEEPTRIHEEIILEERYKNICDMYSNHFGEPKFLINSLKVMLNVSMIGSNITYAESPYRDKLVKLAEKIVRSEFNVDEGEVIFDLELTDIGGITLPGEIDVETKVKDDFEQSDNYDVLKKRTINALSQGSALKSHYIFHLYNEEFNKIIPNITHYYNGALIANDLMYFLFNDDGLQQNVSGSESDLNAGYCRINFDGDIPVIEAKAINTPILIHEITKALITLFSIPGIQNMDQSVIDQTDFLMGEIWDIRFGPNIWSEFHSIIDEKDYDIKKLIITELFKMDSEKFVTEFMYNVLNVPDIAKKEVSYIVKNIRNKIMEYNFEKDSDDVDLSELGF